MPGVQLEAHARHRADAGDGHLVRLSLEDVRRQRDAVPHLRAEGVGQLGAEHDLVHGLRGSSFAEVRRELADVRDVGDEVGVAPADRRRRAHLAGNRFDPLHLVELREPELAPFIGGEVAGAGVPHLADALGRALQLVEARQERRRRDRHRDGQTSNRDRAAAGHRGR